MEAIKVVITLNSPLLIARPENGDENSRTSLDYIPGSTIKGAVIKQYLKQKQVSISDDVLQNLDSEIRKLFFSDEVQFLNGYLYSENIPSAPRALPTPSSWFIEKVDKELQNTSRDIWDFTVERGALDQPKTEPRRYFWNYPEDMGDERWRYSLASTDFITIIHNASSDPHQKSSTTSTVFRYQLINSGQVFCSFIISKDKQLLKDLLVSIPEGKVWLGASSKSSYGETNFNRELLSNWMEYHSSGDQQHAEIVFTLLSDLIISDDSGESSLDFSKALQDYLLLPDKPALVRCFLKSDLIGGFNRKWGLPIIQQRVIQKGSCFVYKTDEILSPESSKIKELVKWGLGERRGDGFGRIAVNLNHLPKFSSCSLDVQTAQVVVLPPASNFLIKRMIKKRLDRKVDAAILSYVGSVDVVSQPENSQLQKLRNFAKQAQVSTQKGENPDISAFIGNMKKKEASFLQFDRRFLKDHDIKTSWLVWIEAIWSKDVGALLKLDAADWTYCSVVDAPSESYKNMIKFRLLDSVAQKAIKTKGGRNDL